MKKYLLNLDGAIYQVAKTNYIKYIKDTIDDKNYPLDIYNMKFLGVYENIDMQSKEDLRYKLNYIMKKEG